MSDPSEMKCDDSEKREKREKRKEKREKRKEEDALCLSYITLSLLPWLMANSFLLKFILALVDQS